MLFPDPPVKLVENIAAATATIAIFSFPLCKLHNLYYLFSKYCFIKFGLLKKYFY